MSFSGIQISFGSFTCCTELMIAKTSFLFIWKCLFNLILFTIAFIAFFAFIKFDDELLGFFSTKCVVGAETKRVQFTSRSVLVYLTNGENTFFARLFTFSNVICLEA